MDIKLMAVGDISLETKSDKSPFLKVQKVLSRKDILFGNLETVLSCKGKKSEKAKLLYSSPEKAKYLKMAGFDILNVANNHILDLGPEGFRKTLATLEKANLEYIGENTRGNRQNFKIIEKKAMKFGFLGYTKAVSKFYDGVIYLNEMNKNKIISDIKKVKEKCDVIIVSLHWGIEDVSYPSPDQIHFARSLIDNGASTILGHHPHFVQGIESYKNGLIAYSLGNFQFNIRHINTGRIENRGNESIILNINFSEYGLESYEIIPIKINEEYLPYVLEKNEKEDLQKFISKLSEPIIKDLIFENWWFEQIAKNYLLGNIGSWIIRIKKFGIKHFIKFVRWLISPFNIKCYLAILRKRIKGL